MVLLAGYLACRDLEMKRIFIKIRLNKSQIYSINSFLPYNDQNEWINQRSLQKHPKKVVGKFSFLKTSRKTRIK